MNEYRNARWHDAAKTTIIAEVNHPTLGWIPTGLRGDCPETGDDFRRLAADEVAPYQPPAPTPQQVNEERARRLAAGKCFTVSWQPEPILMTAREFDLVILSDLRSSAEWAIANGDTTPVIYRDGANIIHSLTPTQFLELATAGKQWVQQVMAVSWNMKDRGIPFDYDADPRWP